MIEIEEEIVDIQEEKSNKEAKNLEENTNQFESPSLSTRPSSTKKINLDLIAEEEQLKMAIEESLKNNFDPNLKKPKRKIIQIENDDVEDLNNNNIDKALHDPHPSIPLPQNKKLKSKIIKISSDLFDDPSPTVPRSSNEQKKDPIGSDNSNLISPQKVEKKEENLPPNAEINQTKLNRVITNPIRIVFRTNKGKIENKFDAEDKISDLYNFLIQQHSFPNDLLLVIPFPRQEIPFSQSTLSSLSLPKTLLLIVEE